MTHKCTNCSKEVSYKNKVSWMNVRTKLKRDGYYHCRQCAGKIGRENSDKKPTGRPKGSKTRPELRINHARPGNGQRLNETLTFEQRMLGIARRNGFDTYEEYRESLPALKRYRIDVKRITENQPLHLLENYDKRANNGTEGGYTLDHIISVLRGFKENIPAETIGHISNLQMLPWKENISKGWK